MRIRLEVAKNRSMAWPWALRTMKKVKGHKVAHEEGLEVHTMEFDTAAEFAAVFDLVRSWKMVNVYRDGKLLGKADAYNLYWKERQTDGALSGLTRALRASENDAWRRGQKPPEDD